MLSLSRFLFDLVIIMCLKKDNNSLSENDFLAKVTVNHYNSTVRKQCAIEIKILLYLRCFPLSYTM